VALSSNLVQVEGADARITYRNVTVSVATAKTTSANSHYGQKFEPILG
jgi:hypothetical protein